MNKFQKLFRKEIVQFSEDIHNKHDQAALLDSINCLKYFDNFFGKSDNILEINNKIHSFLYCKTVKKEECMPLIFCPFNKNNIERNIVIITEPINIMFNRTFADFGEGIFVFKLFFKLLYDSLTYELSIPIITIDNKTDNELKKIIKII